MGATSGKLTVNASEGKPKTEATVEPAKLSASKQNASQLVNGEPGSINDVPPIDEVIDESTTRTHLSSSPPGKSDETSCHGDQSTPGPNGNLNVSAGTGSSKKKSKKYTDWLKQRMSFSHERGKKSSSKSKITDAPEIPSETTVDTTPNESKVQAENGIVKEPELPLSPEITETATCLVEEAISSAVAETAHEPVHEPIHEPSFTENRLEALPTTPEQTEPIENAQGDDVIIEKTHEDDVIAENHAVSPLLNSSDQFLPDDYQETTKEDQTDAQHEVDEHPCLDTNNTNVAREEQNGPEDDLPSERPSYDFDERMISKLAGLDLTNGHSEVVYANESHSADAMVNGE